MGSRIVGRFVGTLILALVVTGGRYLYGLTPSGQAHHECAAASMWWNDSVELAETSIASSFDVRFSTGKGNRATAVASNATLVSAKATQEAAPVPTMGPTIQAGILHNYDLSIDFTGSIAAGIVPDYEKYATETTASDRHMQSLQRQLDADCTSDPTATP